MRLLADVPGQAVSTTHLYQALEQVLSSHFGTPCSIAQLKCHPSAYGSSFPLEALDINLTNGRALQLMFKDLSRQALPESTRRAKPAFLYDPLREIAVYRTVLAPCRLGTPLCYGTVVDHQLGRYWLFLEKVPGVELYQMGELAVWQQVARWLAVMHKLFAAEAGSLAPVAHLLHYSRDFYWLWPHRAQAFWRQAGLERLVSRYDQVVEQLMALPVTFIHGEFYASNVLVQQAGGALRVCPIDWEMAAVAPGLIDLAALTAGQWTEEEKEALATAYYAALAPDGGWPQTAEAFRTALDYCHLHLAMQWLGWSQQWSPPPQHAHNWLGEALRLAGKLGLS